MSVRLSACLLPAWHLAGRASRRACPVAQQGIIMNSLTFTSKMLLALFLKPFSSNSVAKIKTRGKGKNRVIFDANFIKIKPDLLPVL
jgi:hypothetical protein